LFIGVESFVNKFIFKLCQQFSRAGLVAHFPSNFIFLAAPLPSQRVYLLGTFDLN
jgi:hypothetical protein